MYDDEIIEELDDNVEEQTSPFSNRKMNGNNSSNVPSALANRNLNNRRARATNNSNNKPNANQIPPSNQNNRNNNHNGEKNNNNNSNNNSNSKSSNNNKPKRNHQSSKDSAVANKLKKKNNLSSLFNRNKKKKNDSNKAEGNDNDDANNVNDDASQQVDEIVAKTKKAILIINIILIIGGILLVVGLILIIIVFIASIFGISVDFSDLGATANLDPTLPYYKEAKEYHENLNKYSKKYADECGVFLNKSYIHATLTHLWNITDLGYDEKKQYNLMADNVDDVAKLMVTDCVVDYNVGGTFYNKLKDSSFLKRYYKEALEYMDSESIVQGIFDYTELGVKLSALNSGYISDNLKVTLGTCEQPYNNKLLNEGTNYSSTVGFRDYIIGTVYAEVEDHITVEKQEFLKAMVIAATSYVLNRSKYQAGNQEIFAYNGNCWQVSCDIHEGCHYTKDLPGGYGTAFTGPDSSGKYWKKPIDDNQLAIMNSVLEDVYGKVMLDANGGFVWAGYKDKYSACGDSQYGCMGQDDAAEDAKNGMSYTEILNKYYKNFTLSNMQEDSYTGDVTYNTGGYSGQLVKYYQTDYQQQFCGQNITISEAGCGPTAMAIVLSTFVDKKYTPPVVMQEAYAGNFCGGSIDGTSSYFFADSAKKHGLGYSSVSKNGDKQNVLDALKSGKSLVIAHMGNGTFTNGGHYIVLSEVRSDGKVYVHDPYHEVNAKRRNSGNGWYDFNDVIVKELKGSFHIITKR